ncbi:hypothetical protein ElyMa_003287000 [Elysia marginata]|uniref:Uncharacterized protein n=1 Tax=Elysia marginata TaxID=1093978 RepID=A0AAV4JBN0_9GAST|nr:hypothetical protein ElyMa_003287000 [Elysia marginata]
MTKSEGGRKSFSIDALLARSTSSYESSKDSSSNIGYDVSPTAYHSEDKNDGHIQNANINNNNTKDKRGKADSRHHVSDLGLHVERLRETPILNDDKRHGNSVSPPPWPLGFTSKNTENRESRKQLDPCATKINRNSQNVFPDKDIVSSSASKGLKAPDAHFLHTLNERRIHEKQETPSCFTSHHLEQPSLPLLLTSQHQQLKQASHVVSSSSPTPSRCSPPSSSSPVSTAEKITRHKDTHLVHPLAPSSLHYPGDLRLAQFPLHPFHSHLRTHNFPGHLSMPRPPQHIRTSNTNGNSINNSKVSSSFDDSLSSRYRHEHTHQDTQKFKDKADDSPTSPHRPTSSGKCRSPAQSPPRSAHSACSSPRSHTSESPAVSPKAIVGGSDNRGPPGTFRACSPSPQGHSPPGSIPGGAGGFIPRPGLLGLHHHGLTPAAGHLGFQNMFHGHGLYSYPGGSPAGPPHGPTPHHPGPPLMTGGTFPHPAAAEQALKLAQLQGINYAEWLARTGMYVSRMVDYPGGSVRDNDDDDDDVVVDNDDNDQR